MIEKLIKRIAMLLDKNRIPYMLIGGQAVLLYGTPRLTRDIDITLGVDTDKVALVEDICHRLGLKILTRDPKKFAADTKVLPAEEAKSRLRVDFIFSFTPYEKLAIEKARKVYLGNYPVRFAGCEDIIIHKLFAARAIDEEDIKNILIKQAKNIDLPYIRKWLKAFAAVPGQEGIVKRFERIRQDI